MKKRLISGLFSSISDAELFAATMGDEIPENEQAVHDGGTAGNRKNINSQFD